MAILQAFLSELYRAGEIARFQILQNSGKAPKTKMLPYQALIEFEDDAQFSATFSAQAARGIHTGWHGQVMSVVSSFQIEVFRQIAGFGQPPTAMSPYSYACEV